MATTVDELLVRIKADTKGLETALGRVKAKTNDTFKPSIMDRFKRSLGGMRGAAIAAGAALATIAAVKVARVGAEFESLRLSLQQVTGSAVAGDAAFRQIQGFAQESPFQIKDLTKAFIQLKTAGIEPTQELFTTFSDASSVAVDSLGAFQAMVRITQRSAGGGLGLVELEQISDRGIPVYEILTKKLGRTREQLSEMGKSAEGAAKIMKALNEGMQEQFGGATALKMETLNQKLSNMSDAFDSLADVIFNDAGLGGALKFLVDQASAFATFISEGIQMMATGNSRDFVQAKSLEGKLNVATAERETIGGMSDSVLGRLIQDGILTGELAKKGGKESELERLDAVIASIKEQIKERDRLAKIAQEAAQREADQKRAAVAAAQAQDAANEAREQSIENLGSILSEVRTPAELLQEKIEQINAELILLGQGGGGEFTEEQLIETLRRLSEETSEAQEKTQELAETLQDKLLTAVVENVNKFTTDFVMALVNGQNALESFKNFSKQIVSQIIATSRKPQAKNITQQHKSSLKQEFQQPPSPIPQ